MELLTIKAGDQVRIGEDVYAISVTRTDVQIDADGSITEATTTLTVKQTFGR